MISVITPVHNGERFIESCLKSVINQNYPQVEHIIVDGGSTDGTVGIIQQYAENYPHIRWLSESDRGQSDAMNKGVILAKGEIIGILNVDDFYEPGVFNRVSKIFKSLPSPSLVVGNCNIRDVRGKIQKINKPDKLNLDDLLLGWTFAQHPVNPSAYFYHKSLHDKIGLYDVDEHYLMDLKFILEVVQIANLKYIDETWGNFTYHRDAKTFNHIRFELGYDRYEDLLASYIKNLPLLKKIKVSLLLRFKYFLKYPHHLPRSILKKLGVQ
jgi:glycosyltransferase involved in cell wall biosynthesis